VWIAHYFGGGLSIVLEYYCVDSIYELYIDDFWDVYDSTLEYEKLKIEIRQKVPIPAYLVEVKK